MTHTNHTFRCHAGWQKKTNAWKKLISSACRESDDDDNNSSCSENMRDKVRARETITISPPRRMKNMWKFSSACRHKIWWKTYYHLQPNEHRKNCFLLTLVKSSNRVHWNEADGSDLTTTLICVKMFNDFFPRSGFTYIFKLERDEFWRSIDSSWIWVWATSTNAAFSKRLTKTIARIFSIIMMWSDYMRMPTTQPQNPKLSDNLH